ncbi:hypothetical protein DL768_011391 [Monosporascus sp. mg162]|nr:hypothetical protein DL768_011391 [Monosporascus sp. mg162]
MQEPQSSTGTVFLPFGEKTAHHEDHSTGDSTPRETKDNDSVVRGNHKTVPLQSPPNTQASQLPTPPNGGTRAWLQVAVPLLVMRPLQYPGNRRSLWDKNSLFDVPYVFFGFGTLFGYMGIYVVFFYIELYAMSRAGMSSDLAFYLLALVNAGSSLGRILPNFAADYVGTLNMQTTFAFASAVLSLSLLAIGNVQGILAFCVLYGFFTGTFVSLPAPTVASLSPNVASLGARMSMAFMAAGIGSLIGSPIAGAILSTDGGNNWNGLQAWSGALLVLSTLSMVAARTAKVGFKLDAKA